MAAHPQHANEVLADINAASTSRLVYCKHIIKQLTPDVDFSLMLVPGSVHLLLIRNPLDMLLSYNDRDGIAHKDPVSADTTGMPELVQLYFRLKKLTGRAPLVLDADALMANPERILQELCQKLNISFYPAQLSWEKGAKPAIDGYSFITAVARAFFRW